MSGAAACFVALTDEQQVAGYYTLASASMLLADLPATTTKKLPRYPTVPAVRMGRLAIDKSFMGRGLGAALVADALERAARSEIASLRWWLMRKTKRLPRSTGTTALPHSPIRRSLCSCR